jgi:hypothetical protein
MGGITPMRNQGSAATVSVVKELVLCRAKPRRLQARLVIKAKMSYPALL